VELADHGFAFSVCPFGQDAYIGSSGSELSCGPATGALHSDVKLVQQLFARHEKKSVRLKVSLKRLDSFCRSYFGRYRIRATGPQEMEVLFTFWPQSYDLAYV